jgi:ATP-dependent Clp protease protease subunit
MPRRRIVVLDGEVNDDVANRVVAELVVLAGEDPAADILLWIDSPGGSVHYGMGVYDAMAYIPCDVVTYAAGTVAGMGLFLLAAGAKGKRCAVADTWIQMNSPGTADGLTDIDGLGHTRRKLARLYAEHTGQTAERIHGDWGPDCWFTAEEARAYGLIDQVVVRRGEGEADGP